MTDPDVANERLETQATFSTAITPAAARPRRAGLVRLGVVLILFSCVIWFSLFAIPFLPLTIGEKTALGTGVFIAVQITWWTGAALAGPTVVQKLTGWFRRTRNSPPADS